MTTVTLKPTQEVLAKANEETTVVDATGRTIKIKKPGILSQFRLIEALGDTAENQTYMNMVLPLIYVTAVDEVSVNQPKTKMQVEALIQLLDEEGIKAVMQGVRERFYSTSEDQDKAELKK